MAESEVARFRFFEYNFSNDAISTVNRIQCRQPLVKLLGKFNRLGLPIQMHKLNFWCTLAGFTKVAFSDRLRDTILDFP